MKVTILDCYTDEAAGLGVPPYLGTYPRYLYGYFLNRGDEVNYITIDDLRLWKIYNKQRKKVTEKDKTNIRIFNTTGKDAERILNDADQLVVNLGVHVPGKYLSAVPGTLRELIPLIKDLKCKKILTGPCVIGTRLEGGKFYERQPTEIFDETMDFNFAFKDLPIIAVKGAQVLKEIPDIRIVEIETGRGCNVGKCSFCTEPLKSRFINRDHDDIINEIKALYDLGVRYFRIGKQADFYSYTDPIRLLKEIRESCSDLKVLHIDNVNPNSVVAKNGDEITKAIVKYCTEGNIAAFGVESFDPVVVKENILNTMPKIAHMAVKKINEYGSRRGPNGMHWYLPGINIIFGLKGESKKTHEENMRMFNQFLDEALLLRRINIRQVAILPGTKLEEECGDKYLKKNKRLYWKWRNEIRQKIDYEMLKRILPVGTILKDVRMEIYDGKTTFGRQIGTYPLVVGVEGRVELNKFYTVKVTKHMLRSITAEIMK